ncbi:MAG: hypothetical protein WBP94_10915 [Rhodomicrobiaceae bacterium]
MQDPYDIEVPKRAVVSNSGRYLAQAFDGRYRVFDIATGTKLVDRAGYNPNFSPTSRFIVADIGDADGIDFEVIDLVSREIVAKPTGPFVGWLYGDAFLIDGQSEFGRVGLRPTLISRGGVGPEGWWGATDVWRREGGADHDDALSIWASSGCHVCASWEATDVAIDLHAGYVLLSPESENDEAGRVYELATGYKGCCQTKQLVKDLPVTGTEFQGDVSVPHAPHARWLTVLAIDVKGFVSAPHALRLTHGSGKTNRLYATLVGVDTYPNPKHNLKYAKSDARRLADALRASKERYYSDQRLTILLDQDATTQAITMALEHSVQAAKPRIRSCSPSQAMVCRVTTGVTT